MANTLNDLYLKYVNKVGSTLEKDRYFQYLFAVTQAGNHVLSQKNKILHKVVDEEWLSTIEDSLDAINTVIANPRRFVATSEEIVPVDLAKKITADSVRHLSQNTQFIVSAEDGDVRPTRILNVTTEDSYDLYENRFVYHLIQRLITFIDKRTDLIFWSTGDETMNTLCMESKVDDAYETIEYKVEMKIRNLQSFAENDSENMQVFMRIDRVRRMVMSLRTSAFCSLMSGCAKVHSPIQRTNLLMKDPDYRKCYQLWQFLERYDSVGYTIEEIDRALEFDEEYLIQLQTNLVTNYTVFKSILEDDQRNLSEIPPKRRRVLKPKFLKKIEEEIVNDYDIEDVEIRKVIIEEVTQAQLDAEAKLVEETARAEAAERACEEAERDAADAYNRMQNAIEQLAEAERVTADAIKAKEDAESSLAKVVLDSKQSVDAAEKARIAAEKNAEACIDARRDMEISLREAENARKQAEEKQKLAEQEREAAEKQMLSDRIVREQVEERERATAKELKEAESQNSVLEAELEKIRTLSDTEHTARVEAEEARKQAESRLTEAENARTLAEEKFVQAEEKTKECIRIADEAEKVRKSAERRIQNATEAADKATKESKAAFAQSKASNLAAIKAEKEAQKAIREKEAEQRARIAAEEALQQLTRQFEAEKAARIAAEKKLEENSLGKRIRSAFGSGRRDEE